MKERIFSNEYDIIEHALQRLVWTEQKKISQLLLEHELTLPQFLVLVSIRRLGSGCPIGKLADGMFQSHPTMTDIVDRLEKKKLVVRQRVDPTDRRKVVVDLTDNGRRLLDRARVSRHERMLRALTAFSVREQHELVRLLTTYLDMVEKEDE